MFHGHERIIMLIIFGSMSLLSVPRQAFLRYCVTRGTPTTYRNRWKCTSQGTYGVFAPRYMLQQGSFAYGTVIITGRLILKINNDGLPSEYIGLPPCLQALHPGIPDETSATRSIIRSFHVMIILRVKRDIGREKGRLRELRYHYRLLFQIAVLADCQLITLDLSSLSLIHVYDSKEYQIFDQI